jgi:hypothetical protein
VPALGDALARLGFARGGVGLVPASPFRWQFNRSAIRGAGEQPADGWLLIGHGTLPGLDGPSGYSAIATSPQATATAALSDPQVAILYTTAPDTGTFTVSNGAREWTIDPRRPGAPQQAQTWLTLPPGVNRLTVRGPSAGVLSFDGAIGRRPRLPHRVQVEVENLGHAGKLPDGDFTPRVQQALLAQHYDISIFLWAYIDELVTSPAEPARYRRTLSARAALARRAGGACLIADPTPLPVSPRLAARFAALDRRIARASGCTYTAALTQLWRNPDAASNKGLVQADGIHPTAAGYRLIAGALAPVVARIVRARVARRT